MSALSQSEEVVFPIAADFEAGVTMDVGSGSESFEEVSGIKAASRLAGNRRTDGGGRRRRRRRMRRRMRRRRRRMMMNEEDRKWREQAITLPLLSDSYFALSQTVNT